MSPGRETAWPWLSMHARQAFSFNCLWMIASTSCPVSGAGNSFSFINCFYLLPSCSHVWIETKQLPVSSLMLFKPIICAPWRAVCFISFIYVYMLKSITFTHAKRIAKIFISENSKYWVLVSALYKRKQIQALQLSNTACIILREQIFWAWGKSSFLPYLWSRSQIR